MNDWGDINVFNVEDGNDFWSIINELYNDNSDFLCNKDIIVEGYRDGNLYSLRVQESDSMYKRNAKQDEIFCKNSFCMLPCFCIKNKDCATLIWTHTRARRKGFARKLITDLKIKSAYNPLPESLDFWRACDILSYSHIKNNIF